MCDKIIVEKSQKSHNDVGNNSLRILNVLVVFILNNMNCTRRRDLCSKTYVHKVVNMNTF